MWKYGLILIEKADKVGEEDYCELVELYQDSDGGYTSFCQASINSIEDLKHAVDDVSEDGINTWFYDNGAFKIGLHTSHIGWEEYGQKENDPRTNSDEI